MRHLKSTRREFTLQLYDVTPEMRNPPKPDIQSPFDIKQMQQILFANLRRRVCIDKEWPWAGGRVRTNIEFDPNFYDAWLADGQVNVRSVLIDNVESCRLGCATCGMICHKKPGVGSMSPAETFHIHAELDILEPRHIVSVGIVSTSPTFAVIRDWDQPWQQPERLVTRDDYIHAIGLAIDDALYECGMDSLSDEELYNKLFEHTRGILYNRARGDVVIGDIAPRIGHILGRVNVEVEVELRGVITETIVAKRSLALRDQDS